MVDYEAEEESEWADGGDGLCHMLTRPLLSVVTITSSLKYTPTHGSPWIVLTTVGCKNATSVFDCTGCIVGFRSCIVASMLDRGGELTEDTDVPRFRLAAF